jgi:hypothetical protein
VKISKQTFDILKNYSTINTGIVVNTGSELKTISNQKNIFARSGVIEVFETEFALYDLVEFLNVANSNVFVGCDYEFGGDSVILSKDKQKSTYFYADSSTINVPTKDVSMPDTEIEFVLTEDSIAKIVQMASILGRPDLAVKNVGNAVTLSVLDKRDPSSNTFDLEVGDGNGDDYNMYFRVENLKILRGNYTVNISSQAISHFSHNDLDLEYWIALEPDSTYGQGDE